MVVESEGTFNVGDVSLYTKTWLPDGPPKAKLILVHGFSDHINRYNEFLSDLAQAGIAGYGFDQRGWGRSVRKPAQKGLTGPTSTVISDLAAFISSQLPSDVPVFVLGHSMGGGEVLTLASSMAPEHDALLGSVRGWILEAPFVGFTPEEEPSWLTVASGRLAGKLLPHMHLVRPIPPEKVSRDPAVQQSIHDDDLMHNTGTLEGLASLLDRTNALSAGRTTLNPKVKSLVLMHGDADRVCSFDKAKAWFEKEKIEDGEFRTYEGFYHQLHADLTPERFHEDVKAWILARCGNGPESKL